MFAVLVLCLIGMVVAQRPIPCTSPQQWEASVYEANQRQGFVVESRLTYDAVYHRERILQEVEMGSVDDHYDIITLYDEKIEFFYNIGKRTCIRNEITRSWHDFGIRVNDTSYGEGYIGTSALPGAGVLVTIWAGNYTTPANDTVTYSAAWTYEGCIPVSRTSYSPRGGTYQLSFFDVVLGIRDPDVFIPRRECLTDEEWNNRYTLFGLAKTKIE